MKLKLYLLYFLCSCSFLAHAQINYEVRGIVTDTAASYKMVNTTITILNAKDSTLLKYTRADAEGAFKLHPPKAGKFMILITYPGYADYVEDFQLDSLHKTHDFGRLNLMLKSTLLNDVIIKGKINAIKMKGDTTEFDAAAYMIQPNSKVEDLLKQLPGITIDKDGKITAQGKTVNKVLVDGEEFFGDDPTLVTKNLRGDMVDKVQLFDKTSDQAAFTGIDDGEKEKTINIKLKEDKKNGYFGKIDAGMATDELYQGQAMVNIFKGRKKMAAYSTLGNTGKTGLSWGDRDKFGSSNIQVSDDGRLYFNADRSDDGLDTYDGQYGGEGLPSTKNGGAHFSNKWNKDRESINTNYKAGMIDVSGNKNTLTQRNLPPGSDVETPTIYSISNESSDKHLFRQKLDGMYTINLDSSSTIKVSLNGTVKNSRSESEYFESSTRADGTALNNNRRSLNNKGDQRELNATLFYSKKLRKKGRTFSISIAQSANENNNTGFINSLVQNFDLNGDFKDQTPIDQYKTNYIRSSVHNTNATYSEPLSKVWSVVFNYGLYLSKDHSDRKSFNKNTAGDYNLLDEEFSNKLDLDQVNNQVGTFFNLNKNKSVLNFGTKVNDVHLRQLDGYTNERLKRDFFNWSPSATYRYNFSQQRSFRFNYNGYTSQPSISQLQAVKVNTDPLNIYIGNADLDPSFNHSFSTSYSSYKVMTSESIYASLYYNFSTNAIVNSTLTDENGKSTYQPVNLDGKTPSNYNLYLDYNRKINLLGLNVGANASFNGSNNYSMINQAFNTTKNRTYRTGLSISKRDVKSYNIYFSAGPSYTFSKASLDTRSNNSGWGANGNLSINAYLPGKIEINTGGNYEYRGKTPALQQEFERLIWNASISKKFFKKEDLQLRLSGNDLLNQNIGFERSANANLITERRYNTIQRYFMLSLIWDFNKMGGSSAKP